MRRLGCRRCVEQVQVTFGVDDAYIIADDRPARSDSARRACPVSKQKRPCLVERMNRSVVRKKSQVQQKTLSVVMPVRLEKPETKPGLRETNSKHATRSLIRAAADLSFLDDGQAGDVGNPLEFGGTLGRGDAGFPAEGAGGNIERQKFAARRPVNRPPRLVRRPQSGARSGAVSCAGRPTA